MAEIDWVLMDYAAEKIVERVKIFWPVISGGVKKESFLHMVKKLS